MLGNNALVSMALRLHLQHGRPRLDEGALLLLLLVDDILLGHEDKDPKSLTLWTLEMRTSF